MTRLALRICKERDREALHALRDETEAWLTAHGWGEQAENVWTERAHNAIDRLLDRRRFVALCRDDVPVVVGALAGPDMDFWTEADDVNSAWYIARVMTAEHGNGYGAQFIEAIAAAAAAAGRDSLRLDCMRENTKLHDYYRSVGFDLVRIVDHPFRRSGALFERRVDGMIPEPWDLPPRYPAAPSVIEGP